MTQPEGFEVIGKENLVCKLHKSLYGLKQAPWQWYKKYIEFMSNLGFNSCDMDPCCYVKKYTNSYVILGVYVDDMLIAGSSMAEIIRLKQQLAENFEMKDLGPAKQIFGIRILRNRSEGILKLCQEKYIHKLIDR